MARDWRDILEHAADIVGQYGTRVTLRQLFYRLVADQTLRNTRSEYGQLSARTAQARREGWFPALEDRTREIEVPGFFDSPQEAKDYIKRAYRRDRTEDQEWSIYLGVEKAGIVNQLRSWFSARGIPILALQGYAPQSFVDDVAEDTLNHDRPAVLIYAGDFDPSGEDIDRDFVERTDCWDKYIRIALSPEQITDYDLPPAMGKSTDSRASAFIAKHGKLVQVELDALPPDTLRELYENAVADFWDDDTYQEVLVREAKERDSL